MAQKTRTRRSSGGRTDGAKDFDGEGVRRALLAALHTLYQCFPHITLPQYLIALEVLTAEKDGHPHTLATLVKKLQMPFSTASRVVWSLTAEGGDIGVIKYKNHPTDRRKKYLVVDKSALPDQIPKAIHRALADYYGDSLNKLKRAS
ncbi:MAG TPA: hypothetical protein VIN61_01440 [Gammaproteobacteria bacterium]